MDIMKILSGFITNPLFLVSMLILMVAIILIVIADPFSTPYSILYFSESDRVMMELDVTELTTRSVKTDDNKKFIRNSVGYTWKRGLKNVIVWLAKRGTAYTFKPDDTGKGKGVIIGSIWVALEGILGKDVIEQFTQDVKDKLRDSTVFVTVELEEGTTPSGFEAMDERDVYSEANEDMASLIGSRIKSALTQEDYIKNIGLIGIGVALTFLAKALGLITI